MLLNLSAIKAICPNTDMILTSEKGMSIAGIVKEAGVPIPCRIRLFEKLSGRLISNKLTNRDGSYEFDHLTKTKFFVVAHHPSSKYNAVIQDNVVPK